MKELNKAFRLNDRFEVTHVIGKGGQGTALLAIDEKTQQKVAVKKLDFSEVSNWKSVDLFKREVAILFQLDHPKIPKCIDGFRGSDFNFYLIEEFIEGPNLRELQKSGVVWGEEELVQVLTDLLQILAYLHAQRPAIVHRDIKPANIIRRTDGSHALVDFGAVSLAMNETVSGTTIIGTPGYMPMEQLCGKAVPASDLYALAATLVSLATGVRPTELPTARGKLQFRDRVNLSDRLLNSFDRMLEPHVEDRVASVGELVLI